MNLANQSAELLSPEEQRVLASLLPSFAFQPSRRQAGFLGSSHPRRLLRAGNQVGKTVAGAHEAWGLATGLHPWKRTKRGPSLGLIVSADWGSYVAVVAAAMHGLCPWSLIDANNAFSKERGWKNRTITLKNGSQILFRSANQGTTAIAGIKADWVWIDEPPPPDIWSEAVSRTANTGGPVYMTMTPIGRPVEWLREHVEGVPELGIPAREEWEQHRLRLTVEDCPYKTQALIDAQLSGCPSWELPQRRDGEWEGAEPEMLMEAFTSAVLTTLPDGITYQVALGIDHGERAGKECALLACWNRQARRVHIVAEYKSRSASVPAEDFQGMCAAIRAAGFDPMHDIDTITGDVNSAGKVAAGRKVNDLFAELFERPVGRPNKGPGSIDHGVRILNYAMASGILTIDAGCVGLVKSLKNWTGANDDLKDFIDALRYVAVPVVESFFRKDEASKLGIY